MIYSNRMFSLGGMLMSQKLEIGVIASALRFYLGFRAGFSSGWVSNLGSFAITAQ